MDHMRNGAVTFDKLEMLVLDEADRMMDMGFWPDVRRIVAALPDYGGAPDAALLGDDAGRSDEAGGRGRARREVRAGRHRPAGRPRASRTRSRTSPPRRRPSGWRSSCAARDGPVLVFVRTKSAPSGWRASSPRSASRRRRCTPIARRQQRTQAVEGFRSGRYRVLVATDVAARGLDIDGITHVVNYEVPSNRETYVHRVGRTGRADATGTALTLVAPEELRALQALQRSFGIELQG